MVRLVQGALARLIEPPLSGPVTLLFLALGAAMVFLWPATPDSPNLAFYSFAPFRALAVALLAVGVGLGLLRSDADTATKSAIAVVMVAAATVPLEVALQAAAAAPTAQGWLWAQGLVGAAGHLGLGALFGVVLERLRLMLLAPLFVPALLVALVIVDVQLGIAIFNPMTLPLVPSPAFVAAHGSLALLLVLLLWRRGRR